MPGPVECASCRKRNPIGARYCIECGRILSPVFCSSCGTPNPDDLPQCIDCGSPLPDISGIRFGPVVTVRQPTSAMTEKEELANQPVNETVEIVEEETAAEEKSSSFFSRLKGRLRKKH